ncbi:MAG: hypothetical protein ACYCZO_10900 [Daejeonella sp.]
MKGIAKSMLILLPGALAFQACQSRAFLNRNKGSLGLKNEVNSESYEGYSQKSTALITTHFTDSSQLDYEINIFPVDTFSFSPGEGFTGKASSLLIKGKSARLIAFADSGFRKDGEAYQLQTAAASSAELNVKEDTKMREKKRNLSRLGLAIILLISLSGLFGYYWFAKRKGE